MERENKEDVVSRLLARHGIVATDAFSNFDWDNENWLENAMDIIDAANSLTEWTFGVIKNEKS